MPNDLRSYYGIILRGMLVAPLLLPCLLSTRLTAHLERFISWDY